MSEDIHHRCLVTSAGSVDCWGSNPMGELGNGAFTSSDTPVDVTGVSDAVSALVGSNHSCALLADGSVRCWGANAFGQLGDGSTTDSPVPVYLQ